jgi:exodeoxyribonuclease VII large subunit
MTMTEKLSLTELQLLIRDSLYLALPDFYWVVAEIADMKENYAGHCYLELIEKHQDDKNPKARIRAVIWNNRYRILKPFFSSSTGEELRDGMKVLVKVRVEYHEIYGLSLVIADLDPSYTLGEMALRRQLILKQLENEGVITMNRELYFPLVPQKIAVISSSKAAGYSDFIGQLTKNSYGFVFYTALFESAMQGEETEAGIIGALDMIAENIEKFDVVAIIRGGGSQSDLSWFDNYNIAFHVTQFPLPVITGIGHEKDSSVTDIVAFMSLKTPTAVADFLIESVAGTESMLDDMGRKISEYARDIINNNIDRIGSASRRIIPAARLLLSNERELLSNSKISLISRGKDLLSDAGMITEKLGSKLVSSGKAFWSQQNVIVERKRDDLNIHAIKSIDKMNSQVLLLDSSLKMLDPVNVLRRGYTMTSVDGKIVRSSNELKKDDLIDTKFSDGSRKSKVI